MVHSRIKFLLGLLTLLHFPADTDSSPLPTLKILHTHIHSISLLEDLCATLQYNLPVIVVG